jgi:hypothetical protein
MHRKTRSLPITRLKRHKPDGTVETIDHDMITTAALRRILAKWAVDTHIPVIPVSDPAPGTPMAPLTAIARHFGIALDPTGAGEQPAPDLDAMLDVVADLADFVWDHRDDLRGKG